MTSLSPVAALGTPLSRHAKRRRGSFSLEVVTTLLALKLAAPKGVWLTRGNHESKNMNKIYGFEGEASWRRV